MSTVEENPGFNRVTKAIGNTDLVFGGPLSDSAQTDDLTQSIIDPTSFVARATALPVSKAPLRVLEQARSPEDQAAVESKSAAKAGKKKSKQKTSKPVPEYDPKNPPAKRTEYRTAADCPDLYIGTPPCPGWSPSASTSTTPCGNPKEKGKLCKSCFDDKRKYESRCPNFKYCKGFRYWNRASDGYVDLCSKCWLEEKAAEAPECPYFEDLPDQDGCHNHVMWDSYNNRYFDYCKPCQNILDKRCPNFRQCGNHRSWNKMAGKYFSTCIDCSRSKKIDSRPVFPPQ